MQIIEGQLEAELLRIVKQRAPHEAVGLIIGTQVVELPNRSGTPEHSFELHKVDLLDALNEVVDTSAVILWHSHPSGGIGPSRIDLAQKTPFAYHLVVSLVDDALVATWY